MAPAHRPDLARCRTAPPAQAATLAGADARPGRGTRLTLDLSRCAADRPARRRIYVQNNTWAPGGSTGWHTHPGHSLILVTEGAVTAYEGHDPSCGARVYSAGTGFVDAGGDHVHLLRNEGTVPAKTIAVQLIPANATRRVDMPAPGNCPF